MTDHIKRHEFKEWQYVQDTSKKDPKESISIIPDEEKLIPDSLYKLYSLSSYNIDALNKNYIYASHPFELNDKFDCFKGLIDYDSAPDDLIKFYLQNFHTEQEIKERFIELKEGFRDFFPISLFSGIGVISLTGKILNPLMWAHYASDNHGFAVKFNHKYFHEKALGPFPINYQKEWEPISLEVPMLSFLYLTNVKSKAWDYEDEWRFIGTGKDMSTPGYMEEEQFINNRKFPYPKEAIEEVVLGNMFTDRMKKHFDKKHGKVVLALTPNVAYVEQKAQVLEFICGSGIKASYIYPDVENNTFALKKIGIKLEKIDEYTYLMHEDQ